MLAIKYSECCSQPFDTAENWVSSEHKYTSGTQKRYNNDPSIPNSILCQWIQRKLSIAHGIDQWI